MESHTNIPVGISRIVLQPRCSGNREQRNKPRWHSLAFTLAKIGFNVPQTFQTMEII